MQSEYLATSKNGRKVYFDPRKSHAAMHFEGNQQLKDLAIEAIENMELGGKEIATQFDLNRVVGTKDVVGVDDTDEIIYGVRKNCENDGLVPFTKTRTGEPCNTITLHLLPKSDNTYLLSSTWVGAFDADDEPFPQSSQATENSVNYWDGHAFVYGSQEIVPGTETTQKPW